ncbi:hypothetical protein HDU79_003413 [Rhizoclosmatium sp. JEL0117]|nr:hypothetical protein HDU79_003413 [Rhizoclosmatium sp. JEL0117]
MTTEQQPQPATSPPAFEAVEEIELQQIQSDALLDMSPIEAPPPQYDGPVPAGTVLLAAIKLQINNEPNFFNTRLPRRLDGKVPYNVYLHRMQELNQHLNTKASLRSMTYLGQVFALGITLVLVSIAAGFLILSIVKVAYGFALLSVPALYAILVPRHEKFVAIVEDFAKKWTQEDASLNLIYSAAKIRPVVLQMRTDVVLLVYGKASDQVGVDIEELPNYVEEQI